MSKILKHTFTIFGSFISVASVSVLFSLPTKAQANPSIFNEYPYNRVAQTNPNNTQQRQTPDTTPTTEPGTTTTPDTTPTTEPGTTTIPDNTQPNETLPEAQPVPDTTPTTPTTPNTTTPETTPNSQDTNDGVRALW